MEISLQEKYVLSVEEASVYFHIGINKIRKLIRDFPTADWLLMNGSHAYIKRKKFENLIDRLDSI